MPQVPRRHCRQAARPACRPAARQGRSASCKGLAAGALACSLAACAPALDWREFQPEGWPLVVAMPCKPAIQQRPVVLAGQTIDMRMLSCTADGHLFAVGAADVADPARVGPAMQAIGQAAQANTRAAVLRRQPAAVPGMTPHADATRWQLQGQLPDGQPLAQQVQVFAHGTRVFQASVIGPQADDVRAAPFFDALKVVP